MVIFGESYIPKPKLPQPSYPSDAFTTTEEAGIACVVAFIDGMRFTSMHIYL